MEPFSGLATPLGEATESYLVEIWDAGFSTLKRTLDPVSSPSAVYSQAQQIADFGNEPSTVYFKARQISQLVGSGYANQYSAYHFLPLDPYADSVVLAMHFEGANGSTTFTDLCGKTVTPVGNAQLTTTSPKFGTACATFDGAGDYLTIADHDDFDFGSSDITIEFWFKSTQTTSNVGLFGRSWAGGYTGGWGFQLNGSGSGPLTLYWADYSTGSVFMQGSGTGHRDGNWHHVAWTRSGNVHRLFLDGVQVATTTTSANFGPSTQILAIGTDPYFGGRDFNGQIDDLRITRACRWTSNFALPVNQFPDP